MKAASRASTKISTAPLPRTSNENYGRFACLDGSHDFKTQVPQGFVDYEVRALRGGRVAYFNYTLAIEMGLIPATHPHVLNPQLERAILDTLAIQIINEYDQKRGTPIPARDRKPGRYMATRYLQLQHKDKRGSTSGDGRSIWIGQIKNRGVLWDVTACGTGATCLSPYHSWSGGKLVKTGDQRVPYGNGLAHVAEGLSASIMSEIFHRNGVPTERMLAVIEFENGRAINVRAGKNLLRPSHFFHHLRLGNRDGLLQSLEYFYERQAQNGIFQRGRTLSDRMSILTEQAALTFAKISARFEADYIFVWLDWDGDNILADGGIIDYGSVRQFGLFHGKYQYDDGDRWSTRITEQRAKAREIVQTFLQATDFALTGKRLKKRAYRHHKVLRLFDLEFDRQLNRSVLVKMGLSQKHVDHLMTTDPALVQRFRENYAYFERACSKRRHYLVSDGRNRDPIYSMRNCMRDLPVHFVSQSSAPTPITLMNIMASSFATRRDRQITPRRARRMRIFLELYQEILSAAAQSSGLSLRQLLVQVVMRSSVVNSYDRITGDSILLATAQFLRSRKQMKRDQLQGAIDWLIRYQTATQQQETKPKNQLREKVLRILRDHRESL